MSCETIAAGASVLQPKRSSETIRIGVDWHDFLASQRQPGSAVALSAVIRPARKRATGLQYRCTTAGVTSGVPTDRLRWPAAVGAALADGTVVWTAEAMTDASLRTTISASDWPAVDGLTFGAQTSSDLIYTLLVSGGASGQTYDIEHEITCANGELEEQVMRLTIED